VSAGGGGDARGFGLVRYGGELGKGEAYEVLAKLYKNYTAILHLEKFMDKKAIYSGTDRISYNFARGSYYQVFAKYFKRDGSVETSGRDTVDIDFQHRFPLGKRHDVIWEEDIDIPRTTSKVLRSQPSTPAVETSMF
jgi:hypothetical protein